MSARARSFGLRWGLVLMLFAWAFVFSPALLYAEDQSTEEVIIVVEGEPTPEQPQTTDPNAQDQAKKEEEKKKEEPPPKKKYTVEYDANGGDGSMDASVFTEGDPAPLARCTFTRHGYTFEGWTTEPDGSGTHFADGVNVKDVLPSYGTLRLYAQWGSQIYLIRYIPGVPAGSDAQISGIMNTQLAVHDAEVTLLPCNYERVGYNPTGYMDSTGNLYALDSTGVNFVEGTSTTSWEVANVQIDQVRSRAEYPWACQGSVVFEEGGSTYVAVAYICNSEAYRRGSLEDYDSEVVVYNLETGEAVKHASGLMIEHGNDIAYCPENKHFYIAQGGLYDGYPNGIVELDENLNEVRTITPEGTEHIWNITYSNGSFYAIGNVNGDSFARGNPTGETSDLIRMDKDLNVVDIRAIGFSGEGFSGQGMACDGDYLYAILINFAEHDSGSKQRLAIFTLDGEPRGTQRIDLTREVESASWCRDRMFFTINGGFESNVYGTDLASTTMSVVWQPKTYTIEFDENGCKSFYLPEAMGATYDETLELPEEPPTSPGYDFVAWNTEPDGSGKTYIPGETVKNLAESGTVILYAQWRRPFMGLVSDTGKVVRAKRFKVRAAKENKEQEQAKELPKGAEGEDAADATEPADATDATDVTDAADTVDAANASNAAPLAIVTLGVMMAAAEAAKRGRQSQALTSEAPTCA